MNILLWILQVVLGIYFIVYGVTHFVVPDGLPEPIDWMYDLPNTVHYVVGTAEIAGGLGLILPSLTRIQPGLTVWAAVGLIVVMILAAIWHAGREEWDNIATNVVLGALLAFIAYGRLRLRPIRPRSEAVQA